MLMSFSVKLVSLIIEWACPPQASPSAFGSKLSSIFVFSSGLSEMAAAVSSGLNLSYSGTGFRGSRTSLCSSGVLR